MSIPPATCHLTPDTYLHDNLTTQIGSLYILTKGIKDSREGREKGKVIYN